MKAPPRFNNNSKPLQEDPPRFQALVSTCGSLLHSYRLDGGEGNAVEEGSQDMGNFCSPAFTEMFSGALERQRAALDIAQR